MILKCSELVLLLSSWPNVCFAEDIEDVFTNLGH